jgi:hypothetical protein
MKTSGEQRRTFPFFREPCPRKTVGSELELEPQRHLDLPRTSDGLVRDAQAAARRRADVQRSCEVLLA